MTGSPIQWRKHLLEWVSLWQKAAHKSEGVVYQEESHLSYKRIRFRLLKGTSDYTRHLHNIWSLSKCHLLHAVQQALHDSSSCQCLDPAISNQCVKLSNISTFFLRWIHTLTHNGSSTPQLSTLCLFTKHTYCSITNPNPNPIAQKPHHRTGL